MVVVGGGSESVETVDESKKKSKCGVRNQKVVCSRALHQKPLEAAAFFQMASPEFPELNRISCDFFLSPFFFLPGCFRFFLNARLISNKLVGNDAAGHKDRVTNTNALQFELLAKREPFEI